MKAKVALLAVLMALCLPAAPVSAEEKPAKFENVSWARLEFLKFKPGKRVRAGEILEYNFAPARRDAGLPQAQGLHLATGEWDMIYVYPMQGGPNEMEWEVSPEDIAFETALRKRIGEKKADALLAEWQSLVERQVRQIAHIHANW